MLQTRSEVFKMSNYLRNRMKDRLQYCLYWKKNVDIYLANKEIFKKTDDEYYRTRPLLKLILDVYFIPINFLKLIKFIRMCHEYKKNQIEIKVLTKELLHEEIRKVND